MSFTITATYLPAQTEGLTRDAVWIGRINGEAYGKGAAEEEAIAKATEIHAEAIRIIGAKAWHERLAEK